MVLKMETKAPRENPHRHGKNTHEHECISKANDLITTSTAKGPKKGEYVVTNSALLMPEVRGEQTTI